MNFPKSLRLPVQAGFTLIELMLSVAVIAGLMYFMIGTVDQTQKVWVRTSEKVTEFQSARSAFESMTRRLSQATLNAYWRAHDATGGSSATNAAPPFKFRRQSELQFISGPTQRFFGASPAVNNLSQPMDKAYPTHAVFFQAPIGYTEELPTTGAVNLPYYRNLDSLLTTCGYFIEYGSEPDRPGFINTMNIPEKYRYRLMEMTIPSERLTTFLRPPGKDDDGYSDPRTFDENNNYYTGMVKTDRSSDNSWTRPLWMKEGFYRDAIGSSGGKYRFRYAHVRAENVIALVILPKLPQKDRVNPDDLELAPGYEFDSWRILAGKTESLQDPDTKKNISLDNTARDNLLPPIVQVTMVAVDEKAMARFGPDGSKIPSSWTDGLFTKAKKVSDYTDDIQTLEQRLLNDTTKPNYRIFTADIVLRGSKWSRDPKP